MEGGKLTPLIIMRIQLAITKTKSPMFRLRDKQVGLHNPEKTWRLYSKGGRVALVPP